MHKEAKACEQMDAHSDAIVKHAGNEQKSYRERTIVANIEREQWENGCVSVCA